MGAALFADSANTVHSDCEGGGNVGSDRAGSGSEGSGRVGGGRVGSVYVGSGSRVGGGCVSPSATSSSLWSHSNSAVSPGTRDLLDLADLTLSEASEWRRIHEVSAESYNDTCQYHKYDDTTTIDWFTRWE